jgi:hypothetical protein
MTPLAVLFFLWGAGSTAIAIILAVRLVRARKRFRDVTSAFNGALTALQDQQERVRRILAAEPREPIQDAARRIMARAGQGGSEGGAR